LLNVIFDWLAPFKLLVKILCRSSSKPQSAPSTT
jgi:hypothetical protein